MIKYFQFAVAIFTSILSFGQSLTIDVNGVQSQPLTFVTTEPQTGLDISDSLIISLGDTLTNATDGVNIALNYVVYSDYYDIPNSAAAIPPNDTIYTNSLNLGTSYVCRITLASGPGNNVWIKFHIEDPSASVNEQTSHTNMIVYPSPAKSTTTIRFFAEKSDVPVYIFSLNGVMVFSETKSRIAGTENKIELDLTKFEKGTYLVKVGNLVEKLIVE